MIAVLFTLVISMLFCGVYLRIARQRSLLDEPNDRSSHFVPTPHGGGVGLMLAFLLGLQLSSWLYGDWGSGTNTLSIAVLILTGLGIADDLRGLSVRLRLHAYLLVCLWVVFTLLQHNSPEHVLWRAFVIITAAIAVLWMMNLYNFMDGIDGIAAIQTILACCGAAVIAFSWTGKTGYVLICLLVAAAHAGFLVWNFPPARLFMGDAGSVPTGFLLGALALPGAFEGQINPLCWLVLLAAFITDASVTLVYRIATGQSFTQPHRQHAYQRLSRHLKSHLSVDVWLVVVSILWLFPLAYAVQVWPENGLILVLLAYAPLLFGMAKATKLT